ncbi:hypothetical protein, partial [Pseudomonas aeruginosa]|uniref:hypothetical protein n=1 Tax=Pseudomonas aeruginosa TaxID=287 RepID=UPI003D18CCDB
MGAGTYRAFLAAYTAVNGMALSQRRRLLFLAAYTAVNRKWDTFDISDNFLAAYTAVNCSSGSES